MKGLPSKEHYCYKIHTLLMKSSAYVPSIANLPVWIIPQFLQENHGPPHSMIFQKFYKKSRNSWHYE